MASAVLVACTGSGSTDSARRPEPTQFVPIFFYDGSALAPEYKALPTVAPEDAIVSLLLSGPSTPGWRTTLPDDVLLLSTQEVDESIVLQLSGSFWRGSPSDVRERAAQLVYSIATLEAGKKVTLLDGLRPGTVTGAGGRVLEQPLERSDFRDLRPWIHVVQPVAGALVANPIPVRVIVRTTARVAIEVVAEGKIVGRGTGDSVRYRTDAEIGQVRITSGRHTVVVPVRFPT